LMTNVLYSSYCSLKYMNAAQTDIGPRVALRQAQL
jgi:hypothetical protein